MHEAPRKWRNARLRLAAFSSSQLHLFIACQIILVNLLFFVLKIQNNVPLPLYKILTFLPLYSQAARKEARLGSH
jgi:hypothetical protein